MTDRVRDYTEDMKTRAAGLRESGNYRLALKILLRLVAYLKAELNKEESTGDPRRAGAAAIRIALADALGMTGGVYRRMGQEAEALSAYEEGLQYEEKDKVATYNLANVIALSIMVRQADPQDEKFGARIRRAAEILEKAVGGAAAARTDQWWAYADLAQFYFLAGDHKCAAQKLTKGLEPKPRKEWVERSFDLMAKLADRLPDTARDIASAIKNELVRHDLSQLP